MIAKTMIGFAIAIAPLAATTAAAEPMTLSIGGPGATPARDARQKAKALTAAERARYRDVFAAIRGSDWPSAAALLGASREGPLHAVARAELYLAKGSPRVDLEPLLALIETAPDLPQAAQLSALAKSRGAEFLPLLPFEQRMVGLPASPRRERARPVAGDGVSDALRIIAEPLIKDNRAAELEAALLEREPFLTPDARSEWQQRAAWTHYIIGNYSDARRLAQSSAAGTGDWSVQGDWVLGLAAWRQQDCAAASDAFGRVASRARDSEMIAAGHYWGSRADLMCKRPERVQARLRSAARLSETFYGLLATTSLGIVPKPSRTSKEQVVAFAASSRSNIGAAIMLADIGENSLAEQLLRHQARIGDRREHAELLRLAARLNLPAAQYWLAHNGPSGSAVAPDARYPAPDWSPVRGWRVEKALVFAHTLQESGFRTAVVSPAGATGLMQVRPGTAGDIARARGEYFSADQLRNPAYNIEYGQTYLEQLRDRSATGGLLLKVIAAYNAGPVPVEKWNLTVRDGGDPLLYIESLPYWETRGYVPTILRNFWMYQAQAGQATPTLTELAQGKWPRFPTVATRVAQRGGAYETMGAE